MLKALTSAAVLGLATATPAKALIYQVDLVFSEYLFSSTSSLQNVRRFEEATASLRFDIDGLGFVSPPFPFSGTPTSATLRSIEFAVQSTNFEFSASGQVPSLIDGSGEIRNLAITDLIATPDALQFGPGSVDQFGNQTFGSFEFFVVAFNGDERVEIFFAASGIINEIASLQIGSSFFLCSNSDCLDFDRIDDITLINPTGISGTAFGSSPVSPPPSTVPLPAALPLLATGIIALGALGWRRRRAA